MTRTGSALVALLALGAAVSGCAPFLCGGSSCPVEEPTGPGLRLHLTPASYEGCAAADALADGDADLVTSLPTSERPIHAFILATDVDSLSAVQFGIEYDPGIEVLEWSGCTSGLEMPGPGWPASGGPMVVGWYPELVGIEGDRRATAGYLILAPGSTGEIRITADQRIGGAVFAGADAHLHPLTVLGRATVTPD